MTGVFLGHTLYFALKGLFVPTVNVGKEAQTGAWLGSAAFCSGSRKRRRTLRGSSTSRADLVSSAWST
jgi:hypothetical protein